MHVQHVRHVFALLGDAGMRKAVAFYQEALACACARVGTPCLHVWAVYISIFHSNIVR